MVLFFPFFFFTDEREKRIHNKVILPIDCQCDVAIESSDSKFLLKGLNNLTSTFIYRALFFFGGIFFH